MLVTMPTLRVQLLGDFLVTHGGTPLTSVHSQRLQSLLAFLILHRAAPQTRQHLAFLFWPDSTEVNARNNLRQLLFELRRILPDANRFFDITDTAIQLRANAPLTCDVIDFESAIANMAHSQDTRAALEQTVALYGGDLVPSCYDDWIASDREILRDKYIHALTRLIAFLEQANDLPAAIDYAQHLLRHDSLHESTYRHLMQLYTANGDRASALRTYHACATILQRELAVDPSAETRAEYERLLNVDAGATTTPALPSVLPLIGRQREWTKLQATWRDAASGHAQMIVLQGEAGVGKTRLAEELIVWVNRQGIANARAQCYATENALAFAPVASWLRTRPLPPLDDIALIDVARILPDALASRPDLHPLALTEHWQRQRMFASIAHAMLSKAQPLLLVLDDLQWCDQDTLDWLDYFLHSNSAAHACIVATLRVDELDSAHSISNFHSSLMRTDQLTLIDLALLDQTETTALASSVAGYTVDARVASKVYRETEGNPLFVIETVRARLLDSSLGYKNVPPKVQSTISTRLEHLSSSARQLLDVAAIIGHEFSFEVLARACEQAEDAIVFALDELWHRRIIREQSATAYDFSHDKLRQVVLATMNRMRQRLIHRRVAQALENIYASNLDAVSAEIATHYEQTGNAEAAIRYWDRAATVARQIYAHALAIDHYRRALALLNHETPSELATHIREKYGDALDSTGQHDKARETYQDALEKSDKNAAIARARLYRKIATTHSSQQQYLAELAVLDAADAELENEKERDETWWREWIQIRLVRLEEYYFVAKWHEGGELANQIQSIVETRGTSAQRADFLHRLSQIYFRRDRFIVTAEMIAERKTILVLAEGSGEVERIAQAHFGLGFSALWHNDLEVAKEQLQVALQQDERIGDAHLKMLCLTYLATVCRRRGELAEAERWAQQGLALASQKQSPAYIAMAKANLAWVAWRKDQGSQAQVLGREALQTWKKTGMIYAFYWAALFPLLAIAVKQEEWNAAIDYARESLAPEQMRFPTVLESTLQHAIETSPPDAAQLHLKRALQIAKEMRYL